MSAGAGEQRGGDEERVKRTFGEGHDEEQDPNAVPGGFAEDAVVVDQAEDFLDHLVGLVATALDALDASLGLLDTGLVDAVAGIAWRQNGQRAPS